MIANFFLKIALALKSRTCWAIAAFFAAQLPQIREQIPIKYQPWVDILLAFLALYFRLNPQPKLNETLQGLSKS